MNNPNNTEKFFYDFSKTLNKKENSEISNKGIITFTILINVVLILEYFIDFEAINLSLILVLSLLSIALSILHVNNKLRDVSGTLVVLFLFLILEAGFLQDPTNYHGLVFWFSIVPMASLLINGLKNSFITLFIVTGFLIFNTLYATNEIGIEYIKNIRIIPLTTSSTLFFFTWLLGFYFLYIKMGHSFKNLLVQNQENKALIEEINKKNKEIEVNNSVIRLINQKLLTLNEDLNYKNEDQEVKLRLKAESLERQNIVLKEYAYINSHQMRAPIARILGLSDMLKKQEPNPESRELYNALLSSAEEMDVLLRKINDLISEGGDFSREDLENIKLNNRDNIEGLSNR